MRNLVLLDITEEGQRYFDHWFKDIPGLCQRVWPIIATQGNVSAIVPEGTGLERAMQLRAGGLTKLNLSSGWLIPHIARSLEHCEGGAFILQDLWATRSDLEYGAPPHFFSDEGSAVHYFIPMNDFNASKLADIQKHTVSFMEAMFIVPHCNIKMASREFDVDKVGISELADQVTQVILKAYDGEGYVVWKRP